MTLATNDPQPNSPHGLLRTDDAVRARYFEEALASLQRLWAREPTDETPAQPDCMSSR